MQEVIELELSYLARSIPKGAKDCKCVQLEDIYFPAHVPHAKMRIRHKGDTYEFTKKTQIDPNDAGQQREQNVALTADEYEALAKGDGRKVTKTRYYMPYEGVTAEIDVFEGPLEGLVIIEFEFESLQEKNAFTMPDFCLADVTQDDIIAGGVLAGKSYQDIVERLSRYDYQRLLGPNRSHATLVAHSDR